ncbi:Beta-ketoacyl synthase protein, partial [Ancylostoma duodenale]
GATTMCEEGKLELLGQLPLEPALAKALDNGEDFFEKYPDSALAKTFLELAEKLKAKEGAGRLCCCDWLPHLSISSGPEHKLTRVGAIPDGSVDFDRWSAGQKREMSRASQLALIAAEEAISTSNAQDLDHKDTLVNIGTGVADLLEIGRTTALVPNGQTRYGMMGGAESAATACATGLHCIGNAFRSVRQGWSRRAIAGAAEGCVNAVALAGFDRRTEKAQTMALSAIND